MASGNTFAFQLNPCASLLKPELIVGRDYVLPISESPGPAQDQA